MVSCQRTFPVYSGPDTALQLVVVSFKKQGLTCVQFYGSITVSLSGEERLKFPLEGLQ